jgi:hypothetical protein
MDVDAIRRELTSFVARHGATLREIGARQFQVLEIGALVLVVEHYRKQGYLPHPQNLETNGDFHVKQVAPGNPRRYSWYALEKNGSTPFEVFLNLPTLGSFSQDAGVYVVDVAVVRAGSVPPIMRGGPTAIRNDDLVTFVEVKNFRVYPMLLAHFIGIVHELQPRMLMGRRPRGFRRDGHFLPTLLTVRTATPNAQGIADWYPRRGYRIGFIPMFEQTLTRLAADSSRPSALPM